MRKFDESCLAVAPETSTADIKRIQEQVHASLPVFARHLNTSEATVRKWEDGTKRPSGMALKLLAVVEKHGLKMLDLIEPDPLVFLYGEPKHGEDPHASAVVQCGGLPTAVMLSADGGLPDAPRPARA